VSLASNQIKHLKLILCRSLNGKATHYTWRATHGHGSVVN